MKRKTKITAFSGIFSAVGVIILAVGSVVDVMDLSVAAIASACVTYMLLEFGWNSAAGVYFTITVISFLILPNKAPCLYFTAFTGLYGIISPQVSAMKISIIIKWAMKIVFFNLSLTVILFFSSFLVSEDMRFGFELWVYLAANGIFVVYDIAVGRLVNVYFNYYKKIKRR